MQACWPATTTACPASGSRRTGWRCVPGAGTASSRSGTSRAHSTEPVHKTCHGTEEEAPAPHPAEPPLHIIMISRLVLTREQRAETLVRRPRSRLLLNPSQPRPWKPIQTVNPTSTVKGLSDQFPGRGLRFGERLRRHPDAKPDYSTPLKP